MSIYLRSREEGLSDGAEVAWAGVENFEKAHLDASLRRRRLDEKDPGNNRRVGMWRAPDGWTIWEAA